MGYLDIYGRQGNLGTKSFSLLKFKIMLIIPAIDIFQGKVVRLTQGDYNKTKIYSDNPADFALQFEKDGAMFLHLIDLEGAKIGRVANFSSIKNIVKNISIPVEVGGGIRNLTSINKLLNIGVNRVILSSLIFTKSKKFILNLCKEFKERIVFSLDVRNKNVYYAGWLKEEKQNYLIVAKALQDLGAPRIIFTNICQDGTLKGVNIKPINDLLNSISIPLTVAGGVTNINDIKKLSKTKVEAVVIGKAIYEKKIKLTTALKYQ